MCNNIYRLKIRTERLRKCIWEEKEKKPGLPSLQEPYTLFMYFKSIGRLASLAFMWLVDMNAMMGRQANYQANSTYPITLKILEGQLLAA